MKNGQEPLLVQFLTGAFAQPKQIRWIMFCLITLLAIFTSAFLSAAEAAPGNKTVRVGWFESRLCSTDKLGRRSGYVYEYQQKIAAYTGWNYEYVTGSWTQLLQMLRRGEIDLLSDVSYTEERAKDILYSSLPMGEEIYYAFVKADNKSIRPDDYASFNGKKVGINKGSIQEKLFAAWAEKHKVTPQIVELTGTGSDSRQKLFLDEIDSYVTYDASGEKEKYLPVCKIGSSSIYFAVSKNRPDLLDELDTAMSRIQDENPYYNQQLFEQYVRASASNVLLSPGELEWLQGKGKIRVGYRDNYMPYSASDRDGNLIGTLKDYLAMAGNSHQNGKLLFQPVAYPSASAALKALQDGEVDCMFPVNMNSYDAEQMGLMVTDASIRLEMYAIVRASDQHSFRFGDKHTAAISKGNNNRKTFINDHFPNWELAYFGSFEGGLQAVAEGKADCSLFSAYRTDRFGKRIEELGLVPINTGIPMDLSFAVRKGDSQLYSILDKTVNLVPRSSVNAALASYTYDSRDIGFVEFIRHNLVKVLSLIAVTAVAFLLLALRNIKSQKAALERKELINATEIDPLTGLYNNNFFYEYVNRIRKQHPDCAMDAVAMDIDQFLMVNELNGPDFGDEALQLLGREIQSFLKDTEGIASRIEGDRFNIFCPRQEDYQALLQRFQSALDKLVRNVSLRLRMGVMPSQENLESVELFIHAWAACNSIRGTNTHLMVYNEEMRKQELYNQRLLVDMRRALDEHEFKVYYQPKYSIQSEPPRLFSAEALVRWQHPELGLIPPNSFIPLFERHGVIGNLDKYVWAEAARQIAAWKAAFGVTLPVSVNLSRVDIFDPKLEEILDGIVEKNGLDRCNLRLEVTESAYGDSEEKVLTVISRLRDKGYSIEMDDFGSGYSSLGLLSSLPIDVLKMDCAFVRNIEHSPKDMRLVELILDIARNLKLNVVAEGVETKEQMILLKNAGCPLVQGYYFSRPLPPEEFEAFIIKEKELPV